EFIITSKGLIHLTALHALFVFLATGGKVSFNVGNDSPTLTGAKVTFTIDLEFPHNQKVQPNGEVVWAEDCIVNSKYHKSEPVYPTQNTDWETVFPDGTPVKDDKKPSYVFVWKTWEGIEKIEIVQMDNTVIATPIMDKNILDITVTCQGSLPKEVCSVILDAECLRPIHTVCNMVQPSKECQLVLHHFFNDSGVYCINVSMVNDISLAVTSAKFSVNMGMHCLVWQYMPVLTFLSYRFCVLFNHSCHIVGCSSSGSSIRNNGIFLQVSNLICLVNINFQG
uniref:Premelanosome protein b n=1 Tax=Mastacembelus armatus TaxID=205130 RepID=A0A7N9AMZ6_9TELE